MTSLRLRPDLTELSALAEALDAFGRTHRIKADLLAVVHLALEEVMTGLATSARTNGCGGDIEVHLALDRCALVVRIEKRADRALDRPGSRDSDASGLPLDLVLSLVDEVRYRHENGSDVITLRKTIK